MFQENKSNTFCYNSEVNLWFFCVNKENIEIKSMMKYYLDFLSVKFLFTTDNQEFVLLNSTSSDTEYQLSFNQSQLAFLLFLYGYIWREIMLKRIETSSNLFYIIINQIKMAFSGCCSYVFHSWLFFLISLMYIIVTYKYSNSWYTKHKKKLIVKYVQTWYKLCQNLSIISMKCFLLFCFHSYFIPCSL